MIKIISKRARLLTALAKGQKLTAKQIKSRFGVANPSATISDLRRRDGQKVTVSRTKAKNGTMVTKYVLVPAAV